MVHEPYVCRKLTDKIFMFGPGRCLETYIKSLEKLLALPVSRIYSSHGDAVLPPAFLEGLYEDAQNLVNGRLTSVITNIFGTSVAEYRGNTGCFLCDFPD